MAKPKLPQLESWDQCMKNCHSFCEKAKGPKDECKKNCKKFCDKLFPDHKK
ncbi:MAG: hypothetical protein ACM3ZQ_07560 [Bacillota bacterium]